MQHKNHNTKTHTKKNIDKYEFYIQIKNDSNILTAFVLRPRAKKIY